MSARPFYRFTHHLKKDPFSWLFIFLGLLFLFIIPPFQKPDETVQYYKVIALASGSLKCAQFDSRPSHFIPKYLADLPYQLFTDSLAHNIQVKVATHSYLALLKQINFDKTLVAEPTACPVNPFLYLLPAIFLFLPVQMGAHPLFIFYLGRIVVFSFSTMICVLAIKIAKPSHRKIFYLMLLFPMSLQQLSSYSKDAWFISFGLLFFSLFLYFHEHTASFSLKKYLLFCVSGFVLVLSRLQYFPILILLILPIIQSKTITNQAVKKLNKKQFLLMSSIIGSVLVIFLFSLRFYSINFLTLSFHSYIQDVYPEYQLQIVTKPMFLQILWHTIDINSNFYVQSGIGILGWLDTWLPGWFYWGYVALIGFLAFNFSRQKLFKKTELLLLIMIIVSIFFITFVSFYIYWTPLGAGVVDGVQGRYFLILIPFSLLVVSELIHRLHQKKVLAMGLFVGVLSVFAFYIRYYDSNAYYFVQTDSVRALGTQQRNISKEAPSIFLLQIDPTKKLAGVVFPIGTFSNQALHPMMMDIKDSSCQVLLQRKVLDLADIKSLVNFQVLFGRPIDDGTSQVCIQILPLKTDRQTIGMPILVDLNQQPIVFPVYLH